VLFGTAISFPSKVIFLSTAGMKWFASSPMYGARSIMCSASPGSSMMSVS